MVVRCICGKFMRRVNFEPGSNVSGARWEYKCSRCGAAANLYSQVGDWDVVIAGVLETPQGKTYRLDSVDWKRVAE